MKPELELALRIADIHEAVEKETRVLIEGAIGAGALSMSNNVLDELGHQASLAEAQKIAQEELAIEVAGNRNLVYQLVSFLPQGGVTVPAYFNDLKSSENFKFSENQVLEARRLQSSVLWVFHDDNSRGDYQRRLYSPFYVIGEKPSSDYDGVDLILAKAKIIGVHNWYIQGQDPLSLLFLRVSKPDYKKIKDHENIRVHDFSKKEILKIHDPAKKALVINQDSPGSLKVRKGVSGALTADIQPIEIPAIVNMGTETEGESELTSETLKKFSVIENIAKLSVKFERTDEFKEIICANSQE